MTEIKVEGDYEVDAQTLWRNVVRYESLERLMNAGIVRVVLPAGEEQAGQNIALTFRLFGRVPIGSWNIRIVERDDVNLRLRSEESGRGVRRWAHEIRIVDTGPNRCRHTDTVEIDAGLMTPVTAAFARRMYAVRHRERKKMVEGNAYRP